MTTQSWSTRIRHDTDATFREWGLEFNTKLAAAGLVQTADTGQINWTTVTLPGTNTDGGYEIWKLNDSLFGTAPVYFRLDYGTGGGTNIPRVKFTVGTGTDGAGVITGTAKTAANTFSVQASQVGDVARQSYLCVAEGFFGIHWKTDADAGNGANGFFIFARTVTGSGVPDATAGLVIWGSGNSSQLNTQALRFAATAAAYPQKSVPDSMVGFFAQSPSATTAGSDIQAAVAWTRSPFMVPLIGICGVLSTEVSIGSTFTVTIVGSTPHTYIGLSNSAGAFGHSTAGSSGLPRFAMLWE